jgi:autotransporter-associated beta strand protein
MSKISYCAADCAGLYLKKNREMAEKIPSPARVSFTFFPFTLQMKAYHVARLFLVQTLSWITAFCGIAISAQNSWAQSIQAGNVTTLLGPSFFVDDASDGGSDTDLAQSWIASFTRLFSGQLTANQGPTRVILTGFGFAAHPSASANNATSVAVTFTYLGADEAIDGGDDILIGTATGSLTFTGGGEYAFRFASPLTADLPITGRRFRIQIAMSNATNNGSLKLKTGALVSEPSVNGAKLSVAGLTTPLIRPGRVNLAKFQPALVSSTNGQRHAAYLTDGVTGNDSRWDSATWQYNNAVLDFPYPIEVGSSQVFAGIDDTLPISNYSIQYLNGDTWVTIPGASIANNTNVENQFIFSSSITAKTFRLIAQEAPLRIREWALYPPNGPNGFPLGTDLTVNLAYQRPALATAHTAGHFPLEAVDGRTHIGSFWRTTASGTNTLTVDLQVQTKIGSAHLYSGSPSVAPLPAFVLQSWDGAAWQDIPGTSITENTTADLVISFTPISTSQVRLRFTNPGTTTIREWQIFPANLDNVGYPLGTSTIASGAVANYDTYHDAFYQILNPSSNRFITVANSADPALSQSGLTAAQGQYQVLLNLADGSYRLRNRATGKCLSGAQLSKAPGLPLRDETYTALPHQDWILSPTGGGTFEFINQWSGLAIDTQGASTAASTPLIQNTATSSVTQRWQIVEAEKYPKKGIGGTQYAAPTESKWVYRWGPVPMHALPFDTSFYPMQWGSFAWDFESSSTAFWQYYPAWRSRADGNHLMGFNEPDRFDQAGQSLDPARPRNIDEFDPNRTIAESVRLWPRLLALDQPLVSPVPASDTSNWFPDFYNQANNLGYRVDYTSIHLYPGPSSGSSNGLIGSLQNAYNNFDRPVWLTEFSFVDWGKNQSWSEEDNYQALAEFLWRAEGLSWLRKYALFVFTEDDEWPEPANSWQNVTPAPRSNSYDRNGNLTAFGKLYAGWDNDNTVRNDKTYYLHHRQSHKRLANLTTQAPPVGRSIRTEGSMVHWTLVSTGVTNRFYVVSSLDRRRLSSNGTTVTMVAANTTGTSVEWERTETQHGWFYLEHPQSSRRLQLTFDNSNSVSSYTMAATTVTTDAVQWRFIVPSHDPVWTGTVSNAWTNTQAWSPSKPASQNDNVTFNDLSTSNLSTTLGDNFHIQGLVVQNPSGNVSIGGTHTLTISSGGIDLSAATRNLTLTIPTILSAAQTWNVGAGRTLSVNGAVSGAFPLTLAGSGITIIGAAINPLTQVSIPTGTTLHTSASSVLASGATASSLAVSGTLDLRGTQQTLNFLTGSGLIDNTSATAATLTLGQNDTIGTLNARLQNTVGSLTLIKTGAGNLTLPLANAHTGGFTNHGTGSIIPQHAEAFGSGPVVMNGSTLISSAANYTFANNLTLNSATLRVGGSNSRTLTWNGSVIATGNTLISADNGTSGITINGNMDIAGATVTLQSFNYGTNIIHGSISGANGNLILTGTNAILDLHGENTYGGTTTIGNDTFLRIFGNGCLPSNGTVIVNGSWTIRNTNNWIHTGTITGDMTNAINLNAGANVTLAGSISGVQNINVDNVGINVNNAGTNVALTGVVSGATNLSILTTLDANGNGATLRLGGSHTYTGNTSIQRGRLLLIGSNALPDASAVSIGIATLDAATFTDTTGTLDPTTTSATIHLGTGATLAFANSSAVSWTGGRLNVTGSFVSGSSLRFGTNASGLTSTQLGLITVVGVPGPYSLTSTGFLNAASAPVLPFDVWKSANAASGAIYNDHDNDGVANGIEHFLAGTGNSTGFTALPGVDAASMSVTWVRAATYTGSYGTHFVVETSTALGGTWTSAPLGTAAGQVQITGQQVRYRFPNGTKGFARFKVLAP